MHPSAAAQARLAQACKTLRQSPEFIAWQFGKGHDPVWALDEIAQVFDPAYRLSQMRTLIEQAGERDEEMSDARYDYLMDMANWSSRSLKRSFEFDLIPWNGELFLQNQMLQTHRQGRHKALELLAETAPGPHPMVNIDDISDLEAQLGDNPPYQYAFEMACALVFAANASRSLLAA